MDGIKGRLSLKLAEVEGELAEIERGLSGAADDITKAEYDSEGLAGGLPVGAGLGGSGLDGGDLDASSHEERIEELRSRAVDQRSDLERRKKAAGERLGMLQLINIAISDRERLAQETESNEEMGEAALIEFLKKMVEQREESACKYEEQGQLDLAERERNEMSIIRDLLPREMTESELKAVVKETMGDIEAKSIRDLGRLMAELKAKHVGGMDFKRAHSIAQKMLR